MYIASYNIFIIFTLSNGIQIVILLYRLTRRYTYYIFYTTVVA